MQGKGEAGFPVVEPGEEAVPGDDVGGRMDLASTVSLLGELAASGWEMEAGHPYNVIQALVHAERHPHPLRSLRDAMDRIASLRGYQAVWVALPSQILSREASDLELDLDYAPSEIEEYLAALLERERREIYLVVGEDNGGLPAPDVLRGKKFIFIPLWTNLRTRKCEKVSCRFHLWEGEERDRAVCHEAGFYPGECCHKKDIPPPVPIEMCRRCPLYPFVFGLFILAVDIGPEDILTAQMLRQHAFFVAEAVYNGHLIDRHNKLNSAMSKVTMKMSELLDFKKRMDLLLGVALAMLGADRGSIFIYDENREELKYVAWHNMPEHVEVDSPRRADSGIAAWVAKNGRPLLLQDNVDNELFKGNDPTVRSAISMPLFSKGEVFGVLNLSITSPGRRFCEADLRLVENMASLGTVGIENAFLYHRMEEREHLYRKLLTKMISAQEDERKKIASDIHDDTIQSLISTFYQLEVVEMLIGDGRQEQALEQMGEIKHGLQRNIGCMRRLLFDLRPSILDDAGLVPALENYLDRLEQETGMRCILYADQEMKRLPSDVEVSLYRFAQELLTNVRKHAHASEVEVHLQKKRNRVEMRIRDNGVGFDLERRMEAGGYEEHFGIKSLIERVELIGGEMRIDTAPGRGTEVWIRVPEAL